MRISQLFALVTMGAAAVNASDAPVVTSNIIGASAYAELPNSTASTLRGAFYASTDPQTKGVKFQVSVSGLPNEGGPFLYHIHQYPVPTNGNCTGTGAHLDPYNRGETPACDANNKQTCQVGDLSGKYGTIKDTTFSTQFVDYYVSTDPSNPSYFGNLSVVVHLANKTRMGCANFTYVAVGPSGYASIPASSGYAIPTAGVQNVTLSINATVTGTGNSYGGGVSPTGTGSPNTATATPPAPSSSSPASGAASFTWSASALVAAVFAWAL